MKILIVAPAWLGDMVMTHCLVQVVLARHPGVEVHLLAPAATAALGDRMPGVNAVHTLEVEHGELAIAERYRSGRLLADQGFDQAIVLPNSFKSALVALWAGIPIRTGWTGESRYGILNDRRSLVPEHLPLMIERFMALGLDAGIMLDKPYPEPRLQADPDNAGRLREQFGLADARCVAVCPGAEFGPAKRWPAAHFAALARALVADDKEVWLLGSASDRVVCDEIEALVPTGIRNLAGRTGLLDALDLLSLTELVVTNDSGLMHVACALQRPVVAIFGSTSPAFTPPLSHDARIVSLELDCSPCFERHCPLGHLDCLNTLSPDLVLNATRELAV